MAYFKYILVPDVVTYYDALNRSVQTQSVSLNGETISSKVAYNAKGQVSQASLPYFENTTPQYTTFAYNDFLGRKTQQVTPDGSGGSAGTTSNITYNDIELTTTIVSGKNSQTQTNITKTNAFGQVVSVTNNNSKTINYTYDLMGRLSDTWTNGVGDPDLGPDHSPRPSPTQYDYHNGMEYNFHGKRKKLVDMSLGSIASTYDAYDQLRSETNGRDTITKYEYDNLGRVISRTVVSSNDPSATNFETTTYTYGNNNDDSHITTFGKLLSVSTTWSNTINGTGTVSDEYSYDNLGRVSSLTKSIAGDKTYTESYTYDTYGRLNTLTYPGSNLIIQQTYKNGQLYQVNKMDGQNVALTIWEAETKDNFGNITQYNLGNGLQTTKVFDQYTGMLTQIKTGTSSSQTSIQNLQYQYDDLYNITQRKDVISNQQDLFTYDNLNRLTEIQTFPNASQTTYTSKVMAYDDFGNITNKSGVGDMTYGVANDPNNPDPPVFASPYQINQIVNNPNTITTPQNILYTSFNKVRKITTTDEDGNNAKEMSFVYGPDYGRRKTTYKLNGNVTSTKYYAFGNYEEELNTTSGIKKDYYIYGGDGVAAIYRITGVGTNTTSTMYYIHKDNLGSFDKVTNSSGAVVDSYSFDAWGNRRSVTDWTAAESSTTTNNHLFSRGFTGHEHLDEFGLINMNGRCYDPLLGRVLSPDPELQDPSNIQNYNRYSYCLNNPLKYTDPSGYYIYGKTYQADPVYSIPHFSDLDLPGGCRYDIAEYLDERQNRVEMEQMELNSRFGLVGGLGGGGGGGGFDNYLPSIMCEDGRRSYADPADETSGNESNTIMFPQCFETYDGFNTCLYNVLSGISDKWDLYKSTGFFIDQNCLFSGTNDTENGFTSYNDNVICHLEFINSIEGFNAKQISYGDVAGNLIAGNSVIVVTNGYDPTKTMYHAMEVAGMQFNPEDTLLWCRDPNKSYNNEDPLRWFSANALNDNNNCTFYISVWR